MLLQQQTDEAIMAEVTKGKLDLVSILFDRHHRHVFNFLYKMCGDRMLSEDLTQDVFYKIIKYRSSYNNGKFVSWLFTIARNSLKTHYANNKVANSDLEQLSHATADSETDSEEDYSHLHNALRQLEASDREVIVLNRFHQIQYQELAEIIDSTPGAVKTKMSRALKKLKTIYMQSI